MYISSFIFKCKPDIQRIHKSSKEKKNEFICDGKPQKGEPHQLCRWCPPQGQGKNAGRGFPSSQAPPGLMDDDQNRVASQSAFRVYSSTKYFRAASTPSRT